MPGVGHDDVQPAQRGNPVIDRGRQRGLVANIGLGGDDAAARLLDKFHRFGQVGLTSQSVIH